ncbi:hypothetical protein JM658_04590 [Joostella atrarenae]|uniref:Uncharacterized protein n=1 Tax=Joostella atrarenae TaxID=679257 RepID=A0ABS9J0Z0_9FLAO|nr:hypothetical protein [Joostella atrarenae]MCF8714099.1 hypothetical protein [Joostella atrarenae]
MLFEKPFNSSHSFIKEIVTVFFITGVLAAAYSFTKINQEREETFISTAPQDTDNDGITDDIDKDDDNDGIPDLLEDECEFLGTFGTPSASVKSGNAVSAIYSDYDGFWSSKTTSLNPTAFDNHSTLLAFEAQGITYATGAGVGNSMMIDGDNDGRFDGIDTDGDGNADVNLEETTWLALQPVTRITTGIRLEARALDGNVNDAKGPLLTSGNTPFNPYLYEGERGLDMAYTIANIGNSWSFRLGGSAEDAYNDGIMDILLTQGAKLTSGSNYNRLNLLDANGNYLGNGVEVVWNDIPIVGESIVDQYNPNDSKHAANERKGLRFAAVELSEFNLDSEEISKAVAFRLEISSGADPIFFAVNEGSFTPGCISVDTDGDGIANSLDLDSDNDGIYDAVEAGHGKNIDADGRVTGNVGTDGIPDNVQAAGQFNSGNINYNVADSNGDNIFNYMTIDSDSDGCSDVLEAGFSDADADGVIGTGAISINSHGVVIGSGGYATPLDKDIDGNQDYTVASGPPSISVQPKNAVLFDGYASNITISADDLTAYQWQLSTDGGIHFIDLTNDDSYVGVTSETLTIKKADFSMEGYIYKVILENAGYVCEPYSTSSEAVVKVRVKTVISNRNQTYRVNTKKP